MKKTCKLFLALAATLISFNTFADPAPTTAISLKFINNTPRSGNIMYGDFINFQQILGATIERNGGTLEVTDQADSSMQGAALIYSSGDGKFCQTTGGGNIAVNPALYTGDLITITMTQDAQGNLNCSCTGSACDVSVAVKK